jgi:hypothetical protein
MNLAALTPHDCWILGQVDFYAGEWIIGDRTFFGLDEHEKHYFLGWMYAKDRNDRLISC